MAQNLLSPPWEYPLATDSACPCFWGGPLVRKGFGIGEKKRLAGSIARQRDCSLMGNPGE